MLMACSTSHPERVKTWCGVFLLIYTGCGFVLMLSFRNRKSFLNKKQPMFRSPRTIVYSKIYPNPLGRYGVKQEQLYKYMHFHINNISVM